MLSSEDTDSFNNLLSARLDSMRDLLAVQADIRGSMEVVSNRGIAQLQQRADLILKDIDNQKTLLAPLFAKWESLPIPRKKELLESGIGGMIDAIETVALQIKDSQFDDPEPANSASRPSLLNISDRIYLSH